MRINIVTVSSGWILQKIAERTAKNCTVPDVHMTVSHSPDPNADANYYADLQNCYFGGYKTKCDVAYFTHADKNSVQWMKSLFASRNVNNLDGIVSMNKRYTDMIESIGYPKHKLATITPGQTYDTFPLKPIKIGIVSRGGYAGYGQQFMERLLREFDFENIELKFLGNGWDALVPIANERNIKIELLPDADYSIYPEFYQSIDYLLIAGLWTAGPMSMQEALSTGIPIIASDVGFVGYEFQADYVFEPNNTGQLINILKEIRQPILDRRKQVEDMTWEKYANDVANFIIKVKNR